jgi:DNA-binding CsgD family transcriptional regulator
VRAATRLTEIGAIFEGRLAAAAAAHGRAAAAADPAGLTAASRAFEDIGMPLHAAEAAAQAATALLAAGRAVSARAASARAWNLAARCDGVHTPALSGVRAPGLTNRESEVARLAAAGLSSREIADRLTTSVRTVDNHLRAVYTKLGVTGRGGLGEVGMG